MMTTTKPTEAAHHRHPLDDFTPRHMATRIGKALAITALALGTLWFVPWMFADMNTTAADDPNGAVIAQSVTDTIDTASTVIAVLIAGGALLYAAWPGVVLIGYLIGAGLFEAFGCAHRDTKADER